MTLPSSTTIQNLSRSKLIRGYFPGGQLGTLIRKMRFEAYAETGQQIIFNRKNTAPTPAPYNAGGTLTAAPLETTKTTLTMRRMGAQLEIDIADALTSTDANDQLATQIQALKVEQIRKLLDQICTGDGAAPNLNGFAAATDATFTIGAGNGNVNGAPPTIEDLARLVGLVTASDGFVGAGADCLAGTEKAGRFLFMPMRAANQTVIFRWGADLGAPVMLFMGRPVYIGPFATDESKGAGTDLTSIYAFKLNGPTGLHVGYAPMNGSTDPWGILTYLIADQLGICKRGAGVLGFYQMVYPELASIARLDGCDRSQLDG